jgi:hypothetical protein
MANVACTLGMTLDAMDDLNTGIAKGVRLCTSFIFKVRIAKRRATEGKGIVVRTLTHPEEQLGVDENAQLSDIDRS